MSFRSLLPGPGVLAGLALLAAGAVAAAEPAPTAPATPSGVGLAPADSAAAVAPPPPTPAAAPALKHPDLSGHWYLDQRASDDPAELAQAPGAGQPPRSRGPAIDPNQGKLPGEGFDGSDRPEKESSEAAGRQAAREFSELEIFHAGDEFDLTDGMQISRMLRIGGEPAQVFTPRGPALTAAAWEGDALLITERDPQGQLRRTHQLMLARDRNTLTVKEIQHAQGKDGNRVLTLVYRRQDPAAKP